MQILSKAEAVIGGYKRYFTGQACARGHISERAVSDGRCLMCSRERSRAYSDRNTGLVNAKKRQRYTENSEAERARAKKKYHKNAEKARAAAKARYAADVNASRIALRKRYAANPEKHRVYARVNYAANIEQKRAAARIKYAANPIPTKTAERRRRAAMRKAVPCWYGELDALVWSEASDLVDIRSTMTGIEWHADHMIPLKAITASGLHTWNNCQVIPARLNMFKKNKLIFVNAAEWLRAI